MKSVSVSVWELLREFMLRKMRACFEKCAADETLWALWDSVDFASASWIYVCALGWESLQVALGTAPSPCCSPFPLCPLWESISPCI